MTDVVTPSPGGDGWGEGERYLNKVFYFLN